jgi:hypothetical protein
MYRGTQAATADALVAVVLESGKLTDELTAPGLGSGPLSIGGQGDNIDERVLADVQGIASYARLQKVRGSAAQTIGLLQTYAPQESPALRGEAYALDAYAETMLAELFCSGVPLSTLDFQEDFTYRAGSTTEEIYAHASALFDSALAISQDSSRTTWLASVGKARVLLALGQYAAAANLVATVPDTFRYQTPHVWAPAQGGYPFGGPGGYVVGTREGGHGVAYYTTTGTVLTSNDPRSAVFFGVPVTNVFGVPMLLPAKYPVTAAPKPIVLASGVEARLIEAEAALHANANDLQWLAILNQLRTSCTTAVTCPSPAPAGIGGVAGLPPLSDPGQVDGSDSARVTLLFTERAYWLFLTGHRQGDLRRLVRVYHRPQETVYPSGPYYGGYGTYGSDVNLPVPSGAESANPLFHGCLSREA